MQKRFFGRQRILVTFTILIALSIVFSQFSNVWTTQAAGTISGRVFQDFNGNGTYDTTTTITNSGFGTTSVAIDRGIQNVTVTAYDSSGVMRGTTTTAAAGTYTLSANGIGPYRIEFTTLPAGYFASARSTDSISGGTATNAGSTVQFVLDGTTANVNLAVNHPADYSQNNPEVVASMYSSGDQLTGVNNGLPVLVSFPYSSGSTDTATTATESLFDAPSANPLELAANEVGTTYGLAYARKTRMIYAASFFKRHAGFGPGGPNRIYVIDRTGNGSVSTSFAVPGTSTDAHDTTAPIDWARDNDNTGWDGVGKTSLGGVALSDDETTLYVMNLANRTLYALNPSTGAQIASQIAPTNLPLTSGTCSAGDARPFATTYYRGSLYVGLVCTAESTATVDTFTDANSNGKYDGGDYYIESNGTAGRQAATESYLDLDGNGSYTTGETFVDNDGNGFYNLGDARQLRAYVYSVNPATLAFSAAPVFQMPLNYRRGVVTHTQGAFGIWRPWSNVYRDAGSGTFRTVYSQPMLTDIAFDNGNLILGLRDRLGDQVGNGALSNPNDASNTNFYQPRTAGDVIRACGSVGAWTVEANGRCGGTGTSPQAVSEGPGGGEFYYGDSYDLQDVYLTPAATVNGKGGNHDDTANGGVEQMPGSPDLMITNFDPIPNIANMTHDGGIRWLDNTTGNFTKGYRLFNGNGSDTTVFGKAGGIGGSLVILPDPAPIEIGNRVWRDTDADGVQDAGENGIAGVTARLYNASNTFVGTAVTDAGGEYYFVGSTVADANLTDNIGQVNGGISYNTNYQVRFDLAANYAGAGPLTGFLLTTRDQTGQAGFADGSDSDAALVTNPANSPAGIYPVISVTTGNPGENDHDLDAGFASSTVYSLGNRVWYDTNNDGMINAGEVGISGVSVSLFADANADGTPDGAAALNTLTTDASGYYRFDNLAAGNYVVRINPANFGNASVLGGYLNTTGSTNTDVDSTAVAGQNGENGINSAGAAAAVQTSGILSSTIALGAPGEPTAEADVQATGQGAIDAAANMTVDFGFYRTCLSGTVWNDNGAGTKNNNGILDTGENPLRFVRVQLYDSLNAEILVGPDGILGTSDDRTNGMLTNTSGNYNFCNLSPGQYRLVVTPNGGTTSTPTSAAPDDNIDSDDNGFSGAAPFAGKITSGLVTNTPGSAGALNKNSVTNSNGQTSNPTVDFGFFIAPTAIKLENFEVYTDGSTVALKWATGGEAGNLGFNVYRETSGKRELITAAPIAGSALRSSVELQSSGESYSWSDRDGGPNAVYYLEDIDIDGTTTMHGPISPQFKVFVNPYERKSAILSDLARAETPAVEREVVREVKSGGAAFDRAAQWRIAAQAGVKITVNRDGWYRVAAEQLAAAGFETISYRANWQLFVDAAEVPLKIGDDGSIEFFGRGADTAATDKRVYYLVNGQTPGLRVSEIKGGDAGDNPAQSYPVTVQRKDRSLYVSSILNGDEENWFGAIVNRSGQTSQTLNVSRLDQSGEARLQVKLQGLTAGEHLVNVRFNDVDLGPVGINNQQNELFAFDLPAALVIEGVNSLKLQSIGAGNDVSLIDSVALTYARRYEAVNDSIRFSVAAGQTARVGGFSTGKVSVYEIQNGRVARELAVNYEENGGAYGFGLGASKDYREFIAVANSRPEPALAIEGNVPSNWNSSVNKADFVIIAPAAFRTQAKELADMRGNQGLRTQVVQTEDIADEFGAGVLTADAIRQFLQTAATNWRLKPQYALLFGDSSYDARNYLAQTSRNLVPTRLIDISSMETSSDAWLADFDGDGVENMALGRLPAATEAEADLMVAKLARYDAQAKRESRSSVMIADRGFDIYCDALQTTLPAGVRSIRIDRTTLTDEETRAQILSQLNDNPLMVTYTGHGSTGVWSNNAIFNYNDAANLRNSELSFYMLMTCMNGFSHNANSDSLAEAALKAENGGAFAVWASSGITVVDAQSPMSQTMTKLIFGGANDQMRLGDMTREAKRATADSDVRRTWQLLGDPTVFVK